MKGINSFEDIVRDPSKEIIDFEYLYTHPEAKVAIAQRYKIDFAFRKRLFTKMCVSPSFKQRFYECFESYRLEEVPLVR